MSLQFGVNSKFYRGRAVPAPDIPDSENLQAHYDATDSTTLLSDGNEASDGGTIDEWQDISGNGYHLTGGSPTVRDSVLNGQTAIETDDDILENDDIDLDYPLTVYTVFEYQGDASGDREAVISFNDETGGDNASYRFFEDNRWEIFAGDRINGSDNGDVQQITWLDTNGGDGTIREEGEDAGDFDEIRGNDLIGLAIGGVGFGEDDWLISGYYGEILVYETEHSTSTMDGVESYLFGKWGI